MIISLCHKSASEVYPGPQNLAANIKTARYQHYRGQLPSARDQTLISSRHIQAKKCLVLNMNYEVSIVTELVLPKPFGTSYLGVGHQMGLDPLCGTLQSLSQSARTFCRRNDIK